jgi:hypothetical protein
MTMTSYPARANDAASFRTRGSLLTGFVNSMQIFLPHSFFMVRRIWFMADQLYALL